MYRADPLGWGDKRSWSSGFELESNGLFSFSVSTFLRIEELVTLCSLVPISVGCPDFEGDNRKDEGQGAKSCNDTVDSWPSGNWTRTKVGFASVK